MCAVFLSNHLANVRKALTVFPLFLLFTKATKFSRENCLSLFFKFSFIISCSTSQQKKRVFFSVFEKLIENSQPSNMYHGHGLAISFRGLSHEHNLVREVRLSRVGPATGM